MWVRLTVDDRMTIVAAEACTDHGPYTTCAGGGLSYARLVGLRIQSGFLREANARMAGPAGCTHLREMLQEIATTALQTMWPVRARRSRATEADKEATERRADADGSSRMLNTCIAYASNGPVVQQRWPHLYTGPIATGPIATGPITTGPITTGPIAPAAADQRIAAASTGA